MLVINLRTIVMKCVTICDYNSFGAFGNCSQPSGYTFVVNFNITSCNDIFRTVSHRCQCNQDRGKSTSFWSIQTLGGD